MKFFLTFISLFFTVGLFAQPVNDDCDGVIDLGIAPYCDASIIYDNIDASSSDIGFGNIPSCFNGGNVGTDVWFSFTASDTIDDYKISLFGVADGPNGSISSPQIALYRGSCQVDGLSELSCFSAELGETEATLSIQGLLGGTTYFIRVSDYSNTAAENWGDFTLCVEEEPPISTIDQGSSSLCSGQLYDSGGPNGDYGASEDYVFVICPSQPHQCINFNLTSFNIEYQGFDQLVFYDGAEVDPTTIITTIGGVDPFIFDFVGEGGGGVCYPTIHASSGCMTVQFVSDENVQMEGFAGEWECTADACDTPAPIIVESGITEAQIIDAVTTPQSVVTITNLDCPESAYGKFEAQDNSELGLGKGLLLTSGNLGWALGPNNDPGGGEGPLDDNQALGDADLDSLSIHYGNQALSNDACVIEMDVFVATDELRFNYVFGSEEYPEFTNPFNDPFGSQFNDIFAFLVSGPGITGDPVIGNQRNIAVLPDGNNTFVEINSVNNAVNWEYYRDNQLGQSIQYDGLTSGFMGTEKYLTAIQPVIPCNTYHLKLAIADRGDFVYDSGVFVSEIKGATPNLSVQFNSGLDYFTEECSTETDSLVIELTSTSTEVITYQVTIGGTAILGTDYQINLPASIQFNPGENRLVFPITIFADLLDEETETIIFTLSNDFGCGLVELSSISIDLVDALDISINVDQDSIYACVGEMLTLEVTGGQDYFWTPAGLFDNPNIVNPTLQSIQEGWIYVEGRAGVCSDIDSVYIRAIDPEITILPLTGTAICQGDDVTLTVEDNVNGQGFFWTPNPDITDNQATTITVSPDFSTTYQANIDLFGCIASDQIDIDVNPFIPAAVGNDTTICQNYSTPLATVDFISDQMLYEWTPVDGLDDPSSPTPIATPDETTTYTVTSTAANGACSSTESITVTVVPANIEINPSPAFICSGESIQLTATTSTGNNENFQWLPEFGTLPDSSALSIEVMPEFSTYYYTTLTIGACSLFDSVLVRVDSLPNLAIEADPVKDPYCAGDQIILSSPPYESYLYPDMTHQWNNGPGMESPDSLYNLVLTAQDTFTYIRITQNNACIDTVEITINVEKPIPMVLTPAASTICPGETVDFSLDYAGSSALTWSSDPEGATFSCDDCLTPTVGTGQSTTITVKDDAVCPSSASATIQVINSPLVNLPNDFSICAGDMDSILLYPPPYFDQNTYMWSSPTDNSISSTDPGLVVLPQETTTYVLTASNDCGNAQDEINVFVIDEEPTVSVGEVTVCYGQSGILSATTDASQPVAEIFDWEINGLHFDGNNFAFAGITSNTAGVLHYRYGDCYAEDIPFNIVVIEQFDVSLTSNVSSVLAGTTIELMATVSPVLSNVTYTWKIGEVVLGSTTVPNFTATVPEGSSGESFEVIVTTQDGCMATDELEIEIVSIEIPNVFTPNNDNINDEFKAFYPDGASVFVTEIVVYNRWGQIVYQVSDNTPWDGMFKGKPGASDVYIYHIIFDLGGGKTLDRSGEVTLLR